MAGAAAFGVSGIQYIGEQDAFPALHAANLVRIPISATENGTEFVIQEMRTTAAFDSNTFSWITQFVTCIPDPLGINGETLIGKRRTERPKAEAKPAPPAEFEESTFKTLFPLFADPRNDWLLSALVEGITNSGILAWIYDQLGSIPDPQRVDNLKRKLLLNPDLPEDILFKNCIFCNVKEGQVIDSLGKPGSAISIHNDYPFAPMVHKVFILQQRKHDISQITADEVFCFYDLLYKCTEEARREFGDGFDGFTYGMNYGLPRIHKGRQVIAAGASQPHLHSQVGALTRGSYNSGDRIGLICEAYQAAQKRDYLQDYLDALHSSNLVIEEDENAVLFVPIAQRFNYEVQIMVKDPAIGNILETSPKIRQSLGRLEHMTYMIYQHADINIQSFNTIMHASRLSYRNTAGQRLIVSIYPRTTILALSELAHRNVVDTLPWQAAARLREAKEELESRGPRKLKVLAIGAHPDDIELGCGGTLAVLKARGHEVYELIITDGCGGTNRLPEVREREANAAGRVLNVDSIMFGKIRDGQVQAGDTLFNMIDKEIRRHQPDVVLCHASVSAEHLDHKGVSEATRTVCGRFRIFPLMFEVPAPNYNEDGSFKPSVYVTFADDIMKKKSTAISEHKSEIKRGTINLDSAMKRAKQRASEIGEPQLFAEAFTFVGPEGELAKMVQWMPFATSGRRRNP